MASARFSAAWLGLALLAAVSHAQTTGTIKPWRTEKNIKAVKESTTKFYPQIIENFFERPRESSENLPPPIEIVSAGENSISVGEVGNFDRGVIGRMFPGIGATGWTPPDPHIAVGPNHIVEIVNSAVAFFDKSTGTKTFQQNISGSSGFFGSVGATDFVFDPKAFYDPMSNRFFILGLELKDDSSNKISKLLIAVSDDNNPAGNWFKYRVEAKLVVGSNNFWMDYPSFGWNKDSVVVCGNMFAMSGSSGWGGVQFIVMPKAAMIAGQALTAVSLRDASSGSAQVSQTSDPNVGVIYGATTASNAALRIYAITGLPAAPAVTFTSCAVPSFSPLRADAVSTNGRTLWTVDSRLFNVVYRGGKLYTTHHVSVSGSDARNMVRWYELALNNWPTSGAPSTIQSGNVQGAAGEHTFFPAINVNSLGDISLTFGRSSTSITADMMIASRKASDPPGSMGQPQILQSSQNPNYGSSGQNRWGDYFSVQVDPTNDSTFWGVGMVGNAQGNWQTHIHSWTVSTGGGGGGGGTALLPNAVYKYEGGVSIGTDAEVFDSDDTYFQIFSIAVPQLGQVASIGADFVLTQPLGNDTMKVKVELQAATGSTAMVFLKNWSTGQYENVKSFPVKSTDITSVVDVPNASRYVDGGNNVSVVVRSVLPRGAGFAQKVDLLHLLIGG
jgi:hypothetical protein